MKTMIATCKWEEPDAGMASEVWSLDDPAWKEVQAAIDWVCAYWEKEENSGDGESAVGTTIVAYAFHTTRVHGADRYDLRDVLGEIALQTRYSSGEDLYLEDCPIFKIHGIERS